MPPESSSPPKPPPVLVLSADALAAALLGALLETEGYAPHFPAERESARDALRRLRPRAAVVGVDHEEACTAAFFGPARMTGAAVVLFAPKARIEEIRGVAQRHGLSMFEMPVLATELARVLGEAMAGV